MQRQQFLAAQQHHQQQQQQRNVMMGQPGAVMGVQQDVNALLKMNDNVAPPTPLTYTVNAPFNPAAAFARQLGGTTTRAPGPPIPQPQQTSMAPNMLFLQQQQQQQQRMQQLMAQQQQRVVPPYQQSVQPYSLPNPPTSAQSAIKTESSIPQDKLQPRSSIDAARASAARRRQAENGQPRSSIDGFLNDLGDVGRISDIDLGDLGTMDEVWRMSGDLNRLSL